MLVIVVDDIVQEVVALFVQIDVVEIVLPVAAINVTMTVVVIVLQTV